MNQIFIFGGIGFLGYNLLKHFSKKKYQITTISKSNEIKIKGKNINHIRCDVSNYRELREKLKEKKFNFIINCCGNINHINKKQTFRIDRGSSFAGVSKQKR